MSNQAPPPRVSIGIPAYNGGLYIHEAIESVLRQDFQDLELIISDDASRDDTREICLRWAKLDPRVSYHRQTVNLGMNGNFKAALNLARGEYFAWLAQDDLLSDPTCLSKLVNYLDQHPEVVLCGSGVREFDAEYPEATRDIALTALAPEVDWPTARLEFFQCPQGQSHWVLYGLYRRQVLERIPLAGRKFRGRWVDTDMEYPILANLSRHGRIVALPEALKSSRSVADSAACRAMDEFSKWDHLILALGMKIRLVGIALTMKLPATEYRQLLWVVLRNFARTPFGQAPRFTETLKALREEIAMLRATNRERLRIIQVQEMKMRQGASVTPGLATPAVAELDQEELIQYLTQSAEEKEAVIQQLAKEVTNLRASIEDYRDKIATLKAKNDQLRLKVGKKT